MTLHETIDAFRTAMAAQGIPPPDCIKHDTKLERYYVKGDKKGSRNGFYRLHTDGIPAGMYGSWKMFDGKSFAWCAKKKSEVSPEEWRAHQKRLTELKKAYEAESKKHHEEAAKSARERFEVAREDIPHPYLEKKKAAPYGTRVDYHREDPEKPILLVPVMDIHGAIQTLQRIYWCPIERKFAKRFFGGGATKGHFCPIGNIDPTGIILLAEGYSSGSSLHEATQLPVVCALSSGNLESVAKTIRKSYPKARIVICGDDDRWPDENGKTYNTGKNAAEQTAGVVSGSVLLPDFRAWGLSDEAFAEKRPTDFNDIVSLLMEDKPAALAEIKRQVDVHIKAAHKKTKLPPGFYLTDEGVYFRKPTDDGEDVPILVCSPLHITAYLRDNSSNNWGKLLEFKDPDGELHTWGMPMEMLKSSSGEAVLGEFLNRGLRLGHGKKHLTNFLMHSEPSVSARCVSQTGWHDSGSGRVFVTPGMVYGTSKEKIVLQTEKSIPSLKLSGTLCEWQENVSRYCEGNSRLALALSAAFSAPLLDIVGAESGGLHFFGQSSTGKTTAQMAAVSVYSEKNYMTSWRSTVNGLEGLAAERNDCLMVLNELGQVEPRDAGNSVYMLGNGIGKIRAKGSGSARPRQEWRILFLSSGEVSLDQHIQDGGKRSTAGQAVRCIDIPADSGTGHGIFEELHGFPSGADLANHIIQASSRYYGTAFAKFMPQLAADDPHRIRKMAKEMRDDFLKEYVTKGADGQVRRVAERLALVALGGRIATEMGVTGWEKETALYTAGTCFRAWVSHRGGSGSAERQALLEQVKKMFDLHGNSRFQRSHDDMVRDRLGFVGDGGDYYVTASGFKEICAGHNKALAIQVLTEEGWLKRDEKGELHPSIYVSFLCKSARVYIFSKEI